LGSVQQMQKYGSPLYSVRTPEGTEILQIRGPDIGRCCFSIRPFVGSLEFEIIDPKDETMVGKIAKQWGGFAREFFTKADIWGIKFPPEMETSTKALLLSSVFLIVSYKYAHSAILESHNLWTNLILGILYEQYSILFYRISSTSRDKLLLALLHE